MQINPRQIEAFRTVMLTGSMTVTGQMLKVTQPAISRLIKDLEAEIGLVLFRRQGNRLVPSQEATILFAEVDRFYVGLERIAKIANELRHAKVGSLRIASIGALSLSCITTAIALFHDKKPSVDITLESLNTYQTLESVAGRHFDIGFAQSVRDFPGVDLTPMPTVESVCVVPSRFAIAERDYVRPQDLQDVPFISLGKNSPQRLKIDHVFEEASVKRHLLLETSLAASAMALVESGLGVAIVDPFTANCLGGKNVLIRAFKPAISFEMALARPSHQQHSRLSLEFGDIMVELFRRERAA